MQKGRLGSFGEVSRLTLGGGGIGIIWGPTSREEAKATIKAALDAGIDLLDTAPMYNECESIIGETFAGHLPKHLRITTKCALGTLPPKEAELRLVNSLHDSLAMMRIERADIFFLHSNICADDYVYAVRPDRQDGYATRWSLYCETVIPTMEKLQKAGKIATWGITGSGVPKDILRAIGHDPSPPVIQAVTNLLDSAGTLRRYAESASPRAIIDAARKRGLGVMGIRAVQAGALTWEVDRELSPNNPDARDYVRAAPFRALCRELGLEPAIVAHRYALGMEGVGTVVLGVKNQEELKQCLLAEEQGPLPPDLAARIEALGLRDAA